MVSIIVVLFQAFPVAVFADEEPGTDSQGMGPSSAPLLGSIVPVVNETGHISLSVDGVGTYRDPGTIQVKKPAGATVRAAYLAAATAGFWYPGWYIPNGLVKIDGVGIKWDIITPSSIHSWNHWANVTSLVKAKIDAAPAGLVDFTISETNSYAIDGEILAVIFDDPDQTTSNTIVLLFGGQDITGDIFNIGLAEPVDKTDPNLILDLSLGISFGYQSTNQRSLVDVNGVRVTSSAGGQDDGASWNGALMTVGGIGDTNANPDPQAYPSSPRTDDELYNLLPFVNNGDTKITVYTINPTNDDNIFFAALFLASTTAVVGEGIVLAPMGHTNPLGAVHTATATVQDSNGRPMADRQVDFRVVKGPHAGLIGNSTTNAVGQATFTYKGTSSGTDTIEASFVNSAGRTITSNRIAETWEAPFDSRPPSTTATRSVQPNANGWSKTDVAVNFTAGDNPNGSGIKELRYSVNGGPETIVTDTTASLALSTDGAHNVAYYAKDNAGNAETPRTLMVMIDKTAPTIKGAQTPGANASGWNNSEVSVRFACSDSLSDVETCSAPATLSREGANQSATGTAVDKAGNSASVTIANISIDTTNPKVAVSRTPSPNANGWNNTTVEATFNASDDLSGLETGATEKVSLSLEGTNLGASRTFTDKAGNAATGFISGINIDKTKPSITIASPTARSYRTSESLTLQFNTADALSGVSATTATLDGAPVTNGQTLNLAGKVGSHTFTGSATDNAGNVQSNSVTFDVLIDATVNCDPNNLEKSTSGGWITCRIQLPDGYDVAAIDDASVQLNGASAYVERQGSTQPAAGGSNVIGPVNGGIKQRMVKFDRQAVINSLGPATGSVVLTVTGRLADGRGFIGSDSIHVVGQDGSAGQGKATKQ